jgi:hypothetical protein
MMSKRFFSESGKLAKQNIIICFISNRLFDYDELEKNYKKTDEHLKLKEQKVNTLENEIESFEAKHRDLELE